MELLLVSLPGKPSTPVRCQVCPAAKSQNTVCPPGSSSNRPGHYLVNSESVVIISQTNLTTSLTETMDYGLLALFLYQKDVLPLNLSTSSPPFSQLDMFGFWVLVCNYLVRDQIYFPKSCPAFPFLELMYQNLALFSNMPVDKFLFPWLQGMVRWPCQSHLEAIFLCKLRLIASDDRLGHKQRSAEPEPCQLHFFGHQSLNKSQT